MNEVSLADMRIQLDLALNDNICVRAWLGHADVLFLGLGKNVIPGIILGKGASQLKQSKPPYELQTQSCNWWIEHEIGILGSSRDDKRAWAAATSLIGRAVARWGFQHDTGNLRVEFEDNLILTLQPYTEVKYVDTDAWSLRNDNRYYFTVKCNGLIYKVHGSAPVK